MSARPRHVYVEQYGFFWRLPWKRWIRLCLDCIQTDSGYPLPADCALKRRPPCITRTYDEHYQRIDYTPRGVTLVRPLDWDLDCFRDWLTHNAPEALPPQEPAAQAVRAPDVTPDEPTP